MNDWKRKASNPVKLLASQDRPSNPGPNPDSSKHQQVINNAQHLTDPLDSLQVGP
jgi:hypothetical protein